MRWLSSRSWHACLPGTMVQQTEAQYTGKYGQYADLKGKRILVPDRKSVV